MASKKINNPFILTGYYGKAYFCDREEELNQLNGHITNGRNVVLYSWRRFGKTALMQYFLKDLEKENKAEVIYADLLPSNNMNDALQLITQATFERFGKISSGFSATFQKLLAGVGVEVSFDAVTGAPTFGIGMRRAVNHDTSLKAIGEFLSERKQTVVVALDEFQQITRYPENNGEAIFRTWMQSFPGIRFIFCGSHRHMMSSMFAEKNRPFYRSAQIMPLGPISPDAYTPFITSHFKKAGKRIDNETILSIFQWSRQQTYCIQLVCNKLFGMYDHIKKEYLQGVFKEILDQETPVFYNYANLLTQTQWQVLKAVAREEPLTNPLSREFLTNYNLGAASSVSTALHMLIKNEMIIKDEGQYLLHDVLLARWLQAR